MVIKWYQLTVYHRRCMGCWALFAPRLEMKLRRSPAENGRSNLNFDWLRMRNSRPRRVWQRKEGRGWPAITRLQPLEKHLFEKSRFSTPCLFVFSWSAASGPIMCRSRCRTKQSKTQNGCSVSIRLSTRQALILIITGFSPCHRANGFVANKRVCSCSKYHEFDKINFNNSIAATVCIFMHQRRHTVTQL